MDKVVLFVQEMNSPHEFLQEVKTIHLADPLAPKGSFVQHLLEAAPYEICISSRVHG